MTAEHLKHVLNARQKKNVLNEVSFFWQFQYANYSNTDYVKTGKGSLRFQLINQRSDFSFALFSGGLSNVCTNALHLFVLQAQYTELQGVES